MNIVKQPMWTYSSFQAIFLSLRKIPLEKKKNNDKAITKKVMNAINMKKKNTQQFLKCNYNCLSLHCLNNRLINLLYMILFQFFYHSVAWNFRYLINFLAARKKMNSGEEQKNKCKNAIHKTNGNDKLEFKKKKVVKVGKTRTIEKGKKIQNFYYNHSLRTD